MPELDKLMARVRQLETALNQRDHRIQTTFNIPPQLANLLGALLALPTVTDDHIRDLQIATYTRGAISRLRQALEPHQITIKSRQRVGYWFDDTTKARVREMISTAPAPKIDNKVVALRTAA